MSARGASGGPVRYQRRRSREIDAAPAQVFPWLVQMGFDRGGWYAIDRLEKFFGVGRFATGGSARRVVPELQDLAVGERMPLSRRKWLEVEVLDPPRELTLVLPPGRLSWTWRFTLEPLGPLEAPRTLLTIETNLSLPARTALSRAIIRLAWVLFDVGHGLMEDVQLRTLARRIPASSAGSVEGREPPWGH